MRNKKALWITQTAMLIALIVAAQLLTRVIPAVMIPTPLGPISMSQLVTGSLVNLILIIGAFASGLSSAGTAAIISPLVAALFGIIPGKLPQMVLVVMAGNLTIVFVTWLFFRAIRGLRNGTGMMLCIIGIAAGAFLKCIVMYFATKKLIIPMLHIASQAAKPLMMVVSWSQLITALAGGLVAVFVIPALRSYLHIK